MGMGFSGERDVDGQMTLDQMLDQKAKAAAERVQTHVEKKVEKAENSASLQVDHLREQLGTLAKLEPLERYALIVLARALMNAGKTKKGIKRIVNRLLE